MRTALLPEECAAYARCWEHSPSVELALAAKSGFDRDDIIGLAATVAFGGAVSWLCAFHPTELPFWAPWDFSWVEFLATVLGLWWYGRGIIRSTPLTRLPLWRQAAFLFGVFVIYAVMQSHFDYMAQHEFFLNRVQHIFMHHLGPFLLALAWPGETLKRGMPAPFRRIIEAPILARVIGVIQQPFLAGFLFVGLVYLFLIPQVHFRAMIDPRLYAIMNWSMVIDGLLFWSLGTRPTAKPTGTHQLRGAHGPAIRGDVPTDRHWCVHRVFAGRSISVLRFVRAAVSLDHRGLRPARWRDRGLDSRRHDERHRLHDRAQRAANLRR